MNDGYYESFFEEIRLLGRGGFGAVFLCRHVLDGEDLGCYAVKKVPVGDSHDWLVSVLKEVRSLEVLKHENIVDYKHTWLENYQAADFGPTVPCAFILMEYADLGNLTNLVANTDGLADAEVIFYFLQVCRGLRYLHHCGIVYGDLKPENVLLKREVDSLTGVESIQLLLSDFGTASTTTTYPRQRTGFSGTARYTPPEVLLSSTEGSSPTAETQQKAEVWAAGAVLYALAYGHDAFGHDSATPEEVISEILTRKGVPVIPKPSPRSHLVARLISDLMNPDPSQRPTIDAVFDHPSISVLLQPGPRDAFLLPGPIPRQPPTFHAYHLALPFLLLLLLTTQHPQPSAWILITILILVTPSPTTLLILLHTMQLPSRG